MKGRAVRFEKIGPAGPTMELAPRTTVWMAIGVDVASPRPAIIVTARMGAEMVRGVHLAWASPCGDDQRWWDNRGSLGVWLRSIFTGGTVGLMGQPRKGFRRFRGPLCLLGGVGIGLVGRESVPEPGPRQHDGEPQQSEDQEFGEKQFVSHLLPSSYVRSTGRILPGFRLGIYPHAGGTRPHNDLEVMLFLVPVPDIPAVETNGERS